MVLAKRQELGIRPPDAQALGMVISRMSLPLANVPLVASEYTPEELAAANAAKQQAKRALAGNRWQAFADKIGERHAHCRLGNYVATTEGQRRTLASLVALSAGFLDQSTANRNVLLYGPPGTGKDHLLAGLAYLAILEGIEVQWVNGLDWFGANRDRITAERSEADAIQELVKPRILYLSDPLPPWGELSEYQASMLFRVLDGRYRACRATWLSMNVANREEASKRLGAAVVDRLVDGSVSGFCNWPSHRKAAT